MAAIARRPRLALCAALALALLAAACSLMKPEHAGRPAGSGPAPRVRGQARGCRARVCGACRAAPGASATTTSCSAAEQWVLAGDPVSAQRALRGGVAGGAHQAAGLARPGRRGDRAGRKRRRARDPRARLRSRCRPQPNLAQNYWWIRGKSAFLTGHPVEGHARLRRARALSAGSGSVRASREELFGLTARGGRARRS